MRSGIRIAVVGATGVVGRTFAQVLGERSFPVAGFLAVATGGGDRSVEVMGREWPVVALDGVRFDEADIVFCTAGADVSRQVVPRALESGCRVIDNTPAFRMTDDVPLVVPEINGASVTADTTLVACPNCTAINLVMSLAPLRDIAPIRRVVVTSLQSASGAGREAVDELEKDTHAELHRQAGADATRRLAFNCLPRIGNVTESGFTGEEQKIIDETRKILELPDLGVIPTAVRVPVRVGHSLSVCVDFETPAEEQRLREAWEAFPGVEYDEDTVTPRQIDGRDEVVVSRLRRAPGDDRTMSFWVIGDNLRKGAATNSVQIAELFLNK